MIVIIEVIKAVPGKVEDLKQHEASQYIADFVRKYDGVLYSEVTQYTEWKEA